MARYSSLNGYILQSGSSAADNRISSLAVILVANWSEDQLKSEKKMKLFGERKGKKS